MARRLTLLAAIVLGCNWPSAAMAQSGAQALTWEPVPASEVIDPAMVEREVAERATSAPPQSPAEAQALADSLGASPEDYQPFTTLGGKLPSAFVLPDGEVVFSAFQLSPLAGGGDAGGSGNQNFVAQVDFGIGDVLQFSGFFTDSDDPLFAQPEGLSPNPANKWRTWRMAALWQFAQEKSGGVSFTRSLENFFVESGCSSSSGAVCSPNIFNTSSQVVSTVNLVDSLGLPIS